MLLLQDITYIHPNNELLFAGIDLMVNNHEKIALIGNNGAGKSTLLKILAGQLLPAKGIVRTEPVPYYVPQLMGQFNNYSVAQALNIDGKLRALNEITSGNVTEANLTILNDDWTIEEKCKEAFEYWKLREIELSEKMGSLSGGQKSRVFLAGLMIHAPQNVLLDEPGNHLDSQSRNILYHYIQTTSSTLLVVSHDRTLLNILDTVYELDMRGITIYGGNYEFYVNQKKLEKEALFQDIKNKTKSLQKAKVIERETIVRKQKLDSRGKKKQEKAGIPTIMMNSLRSNAEKSTSRIKSVHTDKIESISKELKLLHDEIPDMDKIKMNFDNSSLHIGKILIKASNMNYSYPVKDSINSIKIQSSGKLIWEMPLSFLITSGERIAINGFNGTGKTTLIKLILGVMLPTEGIIERANIKTVYIDQDYTLINRHLTVYEQAQSFNSGALQEYEIKTRLNRFLFPKSYWEKSCIDLSGGERMRLMLCCLTIGEQAPDIIALDEPTNNLDIQNIEILTTAINEYRGTLLVVSHDEYFLKQINVNREIELIV